MEIQIRGEKIKITDAMRSYIEEKIGKLQVVGGYSMYAYEDFTKDEELEFFHKIVTIN